MADNVSALAVVPTPDPSTVNAQDAAFLQAAVQSNLTEIAEGNIALKNTSNIGSREFARWMIGDHTAQTAQLTAIAQQLGVSVPTTPNATQQAEINQLATLHGAALDQVYAPSGVQDHAQTIALFQQEIAAGENPSLIALAQQSLPVLQAHYEQSEILAGQPPTPYPGISPASPPSGSPTTPTTLSAQDQTFVTQAATSGLAEIAEGQIAEQRGNSASSEFGRWMIADHTAVGASLATIAQEQGFTLPTTLTSAQQETVASLASTSNFDNAYATDQVVGHVPTLMQFIQEAKTGTDPALVAFAKSAIPILEQHLAGAAELSLSNYGIAPPTGNVPLNLTSTLAAGLTQASGSSLLSDITSLLPKQGLGVSVNNGTLSVGSYSINPQQIVQLVTAGLHTS